MSSNVIRFPEPANIGAEGRALLANWQERCRARQTPAAHSQAFKGAGVTRFPTERTRAPEGTLRAVAQDLDVKLERARASGRIGADDYARCRRIIDPALKD